MRILCFSGQEIIAYSFLLFFGWMCLCKFVSRQRMCVKPATQKYSRHFLSMHGFLVCTPLRSFVWSARPAPSNRNNRRIFILTASRASLIMHAVTQAVSQWRSSFSTASFPTYLCRPWFRESNKVELGPCTRLVSAPPELRPGRSAPPCRLTPFAGQRWARTFWPSL